MEGDPSMKRDLIRKLIVRAPPDLVAAIYERGMQGKGPSWPQIVQEAQVLGIFTAEEAVACIELIADCAGTPRNERTLGVRG